jgi:hypothetical protein
MEFDVMAGFVALAVLRGDTNAKIAGWTLTLPNPTKPPI